MSVLLIGTEEKESLKKLRENAERNEFSLDDLLDIMNKAEVPAGDRKGFSCILPVDVRVVFSIETHPGGKARHMSVSMKSGKLPMPELVGMILPELGYTTKMEECHVSIEEEEKAINVMEMIK
jgi:hypothetical protein